MELSRAFTALVYTNGASAGTVDVVLNVDPTDPLAMKLIAYVPTEVIWRFSIELVREAYNRETYEIGEGDVLTRVHGNEFLLGLESPEGEATLIFDSLEVLEFLMDSDTNIPVQRVDAEIEAGIERFLLSLTEE